LKYGAPRDKKLEDLTQEEINEAFSKVMHNKIMWEHYKMHELFNKDPGDGSLKDLKVHSMRSFIIMGFPIKTLEAPTSPSIRYKNLSDRKTEQ